MEYDTQEARELELELADLDYGVAEAFMRARRGLILASEAIARIEEANARMPSGVFRRAIQHINELS